ncbi:MAG: hypothetical protein MJZ26_08990 [Fibrobacter sp.]|nr:hypothetical protein [Fibrobacter sp.]
MKTKQEMIFEAAIKYYVTFINASIDESVNKAFLIYNAVEERIKKEQNDKINSLKNKVV